MWSPTHVEVTVSRARNLKAKGKSGTNDAYVTIKLGKEKFQTTLRERAKDPEWHEQCQFPLLKEHKMIKLKVFHRNLIGKDDFLGYVEIQLDPSLVYERPQSRWYNLGNKPGDKGPARDRGEIEVFVTYVVESISGSHMNLNMTGKGRKLSSFKGLAHQFGEKLNLKGSLKRTPSQKSDSKSDLMNLESGLQQSSRTLPSYHRRATESFDSREDERVAGLLEEENEAEADHQTLRDNKPPATKRSSAFKFPFRSKNKRLQKMGLLSQSTLGLPSMKMPASEFGQMRDVTSPPSESSSGFESRRVSTSESQTSSSGDSSAQVKESDDLVTTPDTTLTSQDIKQGSSQGVLSWKNGDSGDLEPELEEKKDHGVHETMASIFAEEVSEAKEIGAFDLGGKEQLLDVQKKFFSIGGNEKIPESPEEKIPEIGTTYTSAEMVSPVSHWGYAEENIQQDENFTVVADSDATVTPKSLSPKHESVSLSPEATTTLGPKSVISESESTDLKQPSTDLKSKSTDLRQESSALESGSVDLLLESNDLKSEFIDQKSESVDLKSESNGAKPESFILKYNSPFSEPESVNPMPETTNSVSDSSDSNSESIKLLPEPVDSNLKSESICLSPKPVISKEPNILTLESLNNDLDSASPKQRSVTGTKQTSLDSAVDTGQLCSPVLDNRGGADKEDVLVVRNNSGLIPTAVGHAEPEVCDSQTKPTAERAEELIGISVSTSQSVEKMEQTEEVETPTPSPPTLLLPKAILKQFCNYSRDDLIQIVLDQQRQLREKDAHIHDLENYIDNLLVKVIDAQPRILSANEKDALSGITSGSRSASKSAEKSSLPSQPGNVPTPKATETYVAYQKVTTETAGSAHVTMVTSPKPAATRKLLNVLKAKK